MEDQERIEKALKRLDTAQARERRHNDYIKENYKRISLVLPNDWVPVLKQASEITGDSTNGMIKRLLLDEFKRLGLTVGEE